MEVTPEQLANMSPEEIKEFQKKNCIFCHMISGKVQSKKVFEDEKSFAILDINPANPGHILLLPKEHYTIMPQIPEGETGHYFMVAKALSHACLKALNAQGTNIFVANGIAAGQKSPHMIIHIIPRRENDDIKCFEMKRNKVSKTKLGKIRDKLAKRLGSEVTLEELEEEKPKDVGKQKIVEAEFREEKKKKPKRKKEVKSKTGKRPKKKEKEKPGEEVDLNTIAEVLFKNE